MLTFDVDVPADPRWVAASSCAHAASPPKPPLLPCASSSRTQAASCGHLSSGTSAPFMRIPTMSAASFLDRTIAVASCRKAATAAAFCVT